MAATLLCQMPYIESWSEELLPLREKKNINIHGMWCYPQKPLQFHALGLRSVISTGPFLIQEFCNSITNHTTGLEHGYNFFFTLHTHFPVWDGYTQQSSSHLAFLSYRQDIFTKALCLEQWTNILPMKHSTLQKRTLLRPTSYLALCTQSTTVLLCLTWATFTSTTIRHRQP